MKNGLFSTTKILFALLAFLGSLPVAAQGSIGDLVWSDSDGNGMLDGGELGITGVTVYLDLNTNGVFDGGEPNDTTDASGNYSITGLGPGIYNVQVDSTTVPPGTPVLTTANLPLVVNLAMDEDFADADFGYEAEDPIIGIAKDESHIGREITLIFYLENLGNTVLSNLSMTDDLDAVFGAGNYFIVTPPSFISNPGTVTLNAGFDGSSDIDLISAGTLAAGVTAVFQVVVEITTVSDQGLGLGTYSNQVTASGESPSGGMTSDLSDFGTDPDPNGNGDPTEAGEDDPTIIAFLQNPRIGVAKTASPSGSQITMDFYIENFGNVVLSNLSILDDLDAVFGAGNYMVVGAPTLIDDPGTITVNGGFDGSADPDLITSGTLAIADTAQLRVVVDITNITDQGLGFGVYQNQANAIGEAPNGTSNSDLSDEGNNPDPNGDGNPGGLGESDPTNIVVGEEPVIGLAKDASVSGSQVTIDFYLENLGNITLSSLSLIDDLNATFGATNFTVSGPPMLLDDPGTILLNAGYDGNFDTELLQPASSTLATGDTAQIRIVVTVITLADVGLGLGIYENTSTAFGQAPGGAITQDTSDDGTDPDPNGNGDPDEAGENDVTPITVAPSSVIGISKEYVSNGTVGSFASIFLVFTVENLGNQTISNINVSDDLNAVYGAGNYIHVLDPTFVGGTDSLFYNTAFNGSTNTIMVTTGTLQPGEFTTFRIQHLLVNFTDQGFGVGIYQNQVTVLGTDPLAMPVSDLSHEGADPDPNGNGDPTEAGENDPTVIDVTGVDAIGIAKDVSVSVNLVTIDFYLENLGTTTIEDLAFLDNLDAVFGAGNYTITTPPFFVDDPGTITLDANYDGTGANDDVLDTVNSSLTAGDTAQIQMVVRVDTVSNQGLGLGNYNNQVTLTGTSLLGSPVSDISDFGTDPDPNGNGNANEGGENDSTPISLAVDSPIGVAKAAAVAGMQVTIDLYLENLGISTLSSVSLIENLDATFGAGNYSIFSGPSLIADPGTLVLNGSFDGSGSPEILDVSSTLAAGATAQIQLVVNVDTESDQGSGFGIYSNQATASGTQPNGVQLIDLSDDGTDPDPNGNSDPGEAGEDDPTPIVIGGNPAVGIAKSAFVDGTQVTFDFFIENLGDVTLSNFLMEDPLNPVFGSGNYSVAMQPSLVSGPDTLLRSPQFFGFSVFDNIIVGGTLRPGEVSQIRVVINVTTVSDVGNGFGIYFNGVDISATGPDGTPVMDTSDEGTDPDPNGNGNAGDVGEDDQTQIIIGDEARIGAAKTVSALGAQATIDIYLENFGASLLSSLSLTEDLDAVFGAGNYSLNGVPTFIDDPGTININAGFDGSGTTELLGGGSTLAAMDTAQIQIVVDVTNIVDQGLGVGNYTNQVSVSATAPLGTMATDLSDSGTDPDPNGNGLANDSGEDDPTAFSIGITSIGVAKDANVSGRRVTFDFYVENLGSVSFPTVSLPEDLDAVFGSGNYTIISGPTIVSPPRDLLPNLNFDGSTDTELIASGSLGLGVTEQFQLVVEVNELIDTGSGLGVYSNQVQVDGNGNTDLSDDGTDPDPNGNDDATEAGENDPTTFIVAEDPVIGAAKTASVVGRVVTLNFYLESFSNVPLSNVSLTEDLDGLFGAGNYTITMAPNFIVDPGTLTLNGGYDGSSQTDILDSSSTLALGATAQIEMEVEVTNVTDQGSGLGIFDNQVTASATSPNATMASDLSENGTDSDPNGNGDPTEAGENDPTPIVLRGSIGDFVWNDLNGDGVQDGGEMGLSGILVFLDTNANGTLDGGEPSDTTDGSGAYSFSDLAAGGYTVQVDNTTVPSNFNLTTGNLPLMVTLFAGEDFADADFGYQQQDATIGDFVWNDLNGDGIQDGGEPGLAGITVFLDLNTNGTFDGGEPSDTTDGSGSYDITDLATGTYSVRVDPATVPAGFVLITANIPLVATIAAGEDFNDADFGYQQQDATIGDFVWNDLNGDGVQDGGEPGLSGVTVYLDLNGNSVPDGGEPSDTSDGAGAYDITDLAPGTYTVRVDPATVPAGFVLTSANIPLMVTLATSEDFNDADFGYQQQDATIGDFVWNDLNGDGIQDGGEPGLSGVTVFLDLNTNGAFDGGEPSDTTDGAGAYDITDLATGTYSVRVDGTTVPAGFVLITANNPLSVNLAAGEDFNDADFGYQQQDATIGDFVWNDLNGDGVQDGGEPGLAGVTVFLDLNSNGVLDAGEPFDTTNAAGAYDITNLATGTYSVRVDTSTVPAGFVLITANNPLSVSLAAGEDFNDADFGYQQQDATIGDFVWNDLNGDGIQDGGEPGLSGITVFLDLNTNGAFDGGEPSDTTDGAGAYDITDLATGTYSVRVDPATVPAGFVLVTGNIPLAATIAAGEDFNDADFGYQQQDATIGDFVWNDLNGDGIQDGGEPGLSGITVYLDLNTNGVLDGGEPSDITDGAGAYDITDLATGTYSVRVDESTAPAGFVLVTANNPLSVSLAAGEDFNDADFGFQQQDATIGDFVWNDLNADGVQDGGEPGLAGVTVYLDLNTNGVLDGGEPSDTTDGAGAYDITDLATGTYSARVDETTVPTGFVLITTNPISVSLAAGEDFNDADFGYQQQDATIGDFVWNDLNGDGVQDAGEPGLAGITVYLDLNTNGVLDAGEPSDVSDGAGAYDITDLATGTYSTRVDDTTVPAGFVLITTNPLSVSLAAGEDFNDADFGYQQQDATIGDFVWDDLNGDGIQDGGEPGLSGITVFLDLNTNGAIDGGEPTDTTDGAGAYDFTDLPTGTYSVMVDSSTVPADFVLTTANNPQTVNLAAGEDFNDADFGYQLRNATIGDFVWDDLNGDGVQDGGEPGLVGVTVYLDLNSNQTLDAGEPSDTTDGSGAYDITDLATGTYSVNVDPSTLPANFNLTTANLPLSVTIATSEDFDDADFGYQLQNGSIGDLVFNDMEGDGNQNPGDVGIADVTLDLIRDLNGNGMIDGGEPVIDTQTTDGVGFYEFSGLPIGDFLVNVTDTNSVLVGWTQTSGVNPLAVTLALSEMFTDADFGFRQMDATIGDFVWHDADGDGVQDPGETGIQDVTIDLIQLVSGSRSLLDTQTTDSSGFYEFTDLNSGTYIVLVTDTNNVLTDYVLTGGANPANGTVAAGENLETVDFGYCLPPEITVQPVGADLCIEDSVTFTVTATGSETLTYQWRVNGVDIPGETNASLTLNNLAVADAGDYDCVVSNGCGSETSAIAVLTVATLDVSINPPVVAQGLAPVTLEAIITCDVPPTDIEWENLNSGMVFGFGENPVTLSSVLMETSTIQVTISDDARDVVANTAVILVADNDQFLDLNGDGCNTIEDLWTLAEMWRQTSLNDANGDGIIDVLDFLFVNTDEVGCDP